MLNLRGVGRALRHLASPPESPDDRERRRERKRAEGTRAIEKLQQEIADRERRDRAQRLRDASAREVRESCERLGWWWPSDHMGIWRRPPRDDY